MWIMACSGMLLISLIVYGSADGREYLQTLQTPPPVDHGFRVEVSFSEKAKKKLIESAETIIVIAYFTGTARAGVPFKQYRKYASRPGPMGLGENEVEISPGEAVSFNDPKLNQGAISLINSQGPQLLLNIVSGRKSSKDNLLDCNIYEGPLKDVERTSIPIYCKLTRGE